MTDQNLADGSALLESAREYVERAIASYAGDPADNQFQKGYLAALEVVRDEAFSAQPPAAPVEATTKSAPSVQTSRNIAEILPQREPAVDGADTYSSAGCGTPGCADPNCDYGKGPLRCQSCGAPFVGEAQQGQAPAGIGRLPKLPISIYRTKGDDQFVRLAVEGQLITRVPSNSPKGRGLLSLNEALTELRKTAPKKPIERWRHKKRGTTYTVVGNCEVQAEDPLMDHEVAVVYCCEQDGTLWVRRHSEFHDGRFEALPAQPQGTSA